MKHLIIEDINADKHLSVAIAATFAVSVSHLHKKPDLNNCLTKVLQWDRYSIGDLRENHTLSSDMIDNSCLDSYSAAPSDYITLDSSKSVRYAIYATLQTDSSVYVSELTSDFAASAARYHGKAKDRYVHNTLAALLPFILNYKINRQNKPFNSPEKILDLLEDRYKQRFIFNLDTLA